jgi:hypothetical protein
MYVLIWSSIMKIIYKVAILVSLVSCGPDQKEKSSEELEPLSVKEDDSKETGDQSENYTKVLNLESELPICDEANENRLYYLLDIQSFFICDGDAWDSIDIHGQQGEAGEAGDKGDQGDKGDTGDGLTIKRISYCGGSSDIGISDFVFGVSLRATIYSDNSLSMTCSMAQYVTGETGMDTTSDTLSYSSDSAGVTSGVVTCLAMYAKVEFNIGLNTAKYMNNADVSYSDTVSCSDTYVAP